MKNCIVAAIASLTSFSAFGFSQECHRAVPVNESIITAVNPYATGHVLPVEFFLEESVNELKVGDRITHLRVVVEGHYKAPAQLFVDQKPVEKAVLGSYYPNLNSTLFCLTLRPEFYYGVNFKTMRFGFQGELAPQFVELNVHKTGNVVIDPTPTPIPVPERPIGKRKKECSSVKHKVQVCRLKREMIPGTLEIREHLSKSPCIEDETYWVENNHIVVTDGCRAVFTYKYYRD